MNLPQLTVDVPDWQPYAAAYSSPWPGTTAIWRSAGADGCAQLTTLTRPGWFKNGALGATSVNAFTTHDWVRAAVLGGQFGYSANGSEIHCIEATKSWLLGVRATARDPDGTCTGFKCSNANQMWLEDTLADAAGRTESHGIEANDGGQVFVRRHLNVAGDDHPTNGGVIGPF